MFADRTEAGRQLAERLGRYAAKDVVVLGLPRGGVPIAAQVAAALGAPLDVIVVRKLGVPFQPELAMGAIGEDGARVLNDDVVRLARISAKELATVEKRGTPGAGAAGPRASERRPPASTCAAAPLWSSTTASPPARPHGPPARWRGPTVPRG